MRSIWGSSFTTLVLQSEDFQPREGGGRSLGNGGPLKLLQSFTTLVLQSEDFELRGGTCVGAGAGYLFVLGNCRLSSISIYRPYITHVCMYVHIHKDIYISR